MTARVVLDTNVVVSALLKPGGLEDRVLRLGFAGKIHVCVSADVLAEYALVLPRPKFKLESREVNPTLQPLRQVSVEVHPTQTLKISQHEPDNRFLECVLTARADFLVTG